MKAIGGHMKAIGGLYAVELHRHITAQSARLPALYERAKATLAECIRIDECKDWADRAEALASYARQAKDDELRQMADRIQARAVRRAGELLKEIAPASGRMPENGRARSRISRAQAAHQAGLSEHQRKTALRVANVPSDEFERAVAGVAPPTVTEMAGPLALGGSCSGCSAAGWANRISGSARTSCLFMPRNRDVYVELSAPSDFA